MVVHGGVLEGQAYRNNNNTTAATPTQPNIMVKLTLVEAP